MKARLLTGFFLLAAASGAVAQQGQGQAFIRMTDLFSEQATILSMQSATQAFNFDIGEKGAVFELWATDAWRQNLTLVDSKTVNVYSPVASIEISSLDAYQRGDPASLSSVRRTRADQVFNLKVNIAGFVSSGYNSMDYQTSRKKFSLQTYGAIVPQPAGFVPTSNPSIGNTSPSLVSVEAPNLCSQGEDPRYACGEHSYAIRWNDPIFSSIGDGIDLAKASIEIWPMTQVVIGGLQSGLVYVDRLPTITLDFKHLYPDSRTFARIYPGQMRNVANVDPILGTERSYGDFYQPGTAATVVPQNYSVAIDNLSNYTPQDGVYTLEVITQTPFSRTGERLVHMTFEVDRIISTRGQLSTRE